MHERRPWYNRSNIKSIRVYLPAWHAAWPTRCDPEASLPHMGDRSAEGRAVPDPLRLRQSSRPSTGWRIRSVSRGLDRLEDS